MSHQPNGPQGTDPASIAAWIATVFIGGFISGTASKEAGKIVEDYHDRVQYPQGFRSWKFPQQIAWLIRNGHEKQLGTHLDWEIGFNPKIRSFVEAGVVAIWYEDVCEDKSSEEHLTALYGMASLYNFGYLLELAEQEGRSFPTLRRLVNTAVFRPSEFPRAIKPWRTKIENRCKASWSPERKEELLSLITASDFVFWSHWSKTWNAKIAAKKAAN